MSIEIGQNLTEAIGVIGFFIFMIVLVWRNT
jgi:hypothetical protein